MKFCIKYSFFIICVLLGSDYNLGVLTIGSENRNVLNISVDHQTHLDYGLSYPITYEITIPPESINLQAYYRYLSNDSWLVLDEKTSNDFFNGIEVCRFDYDENIAYLSISFSDISDSIFLKIGDAYNDVNITFLGISKYYDNRQAVVTSTADDWAYYFNDKFLRTCRNFRNLNLWISCAIVTDECDTNTWEDIQNQLDSGYVEVVSHSRTHPYIPYDDIEGEVLGSKQDLIDNLDLPQYNRYGDNEYIYAWVAPYGEYDDDIDSLVSIGKYLVTRMYYGDNHDFSNWDNELSKYDPIGVSTEVGPLWLGTTDTAELNNTFDEVLSNGGIYHVMCHPNIIEWSLEYPWIHLEYISNRKNIWYTGFGHLYLYHFLQSTYPYLELKAYGNKHQVTKNAIMHSNYPNPFNMVTLLEYSIPENEYVKVGIYDMKGRLVQNLINTWQNSGYKSVKWDGTNHKGETVASGLYLYHIQTRSIFESGKIFLLK